MCAYHVNEGSAHVYAVMIDDVLYQGEGTTSKIAKAIAAAKALEGMQVREMGRFIQLFSYQQL